MADSMSELYKEAQCNNRQTNSDDNESGQDGRVASPVEAWLLWLIGHSLPQRVYDHRAFHTALHQLHKHQSLRYRARP